MVAFAVSIVARLREDLMADHPDVAVAADDLPLIGEPFAVELANTDYRMHDVDFLADDLVGAWWAHAGPPPVSHQAEVALAAAEALRDVRDAIRLLLGRIADGLPPGDAGAAVRTLNSAAGRAPAHPALEGADDGRLTWALHHRGRAADVLVAEVASRCILFLGGDDADRVRRCERAECPMLFVQRHRARRFCHESCAHSVRQARYYRRAHGR
jgi:predicted RNA-binding Zn ribbon-like protein